ncbi:MAG: DNA repair protein RadA [Clostridiales bacterium]|nr:DNA repair protein RadA [Candidatus Crickella merdequi]
MAKKNKTIYMCTECGNEYPAWQGQCSYCGSWSTIIEQKIQPLPEADTRRRVGITEKPVKLGSVGTDTYQRIDSGIGELNRVLGGGIVLGSLILISGEPGIGKSTIIVEAANNIARTQGTVLYVSGEESEQQVKLRADRVCGKVAEDLFIYPETCIDNILSVCNEMGPKFLIIDSIQTMYSNEVDSVAGSVTQIRACSNILMKYAKQHNVPVFIVAHVNKSGDLAGPKTIEHMVDTVLNFTGERDKDLRILRSFKNRFGTTDEIGAFRMTSTGMQEVADLSGSLIENSDAAEQGSVIGAVHEGSRPVFFEIQALVAQANVGFARRTAIGIDHNRLNMLLAVLERQAGLNLLNYDVYVNVVGGMKPDSTATDLAVALAIFSSFRERCAPSRMVAVGEIGLTGNLRSVPNADKIISEAQRLGYDAIILPKKNAAAHKSSDKPGSIRVLGADHIREAIKLFAGK